MNNRLERCLRILVLLQRGDAYDAGKLAASLDVTRRTIFRDIAMLRDMGLDVVFDPEIMSYCVQLLPSPSSPHGTQRVSSDQLADSLQEAFAESDAAEYSQAAIIRKITLNVASRLAAQSAETLTGEASAGETSAGENSLGDSAGGRSPILPVGTSSHPASGTDKREFENLTDKISFLSNAIKNERTIRIRTCGRSELLHVKFTEMKFTAQGWFVSYFSDVDSAVDSAGTSSTVTCPLHKLQILASGHSD